MPDTQTQDEVISNRTNVRGGLAARPVEDEVVSSKGGATTSARSSVEDEINEGGRRGRTFKKSTEDMLAKFDKEQDDAPTTAPHDEGDADEGDDDADAAPDGAVGDGAGDAGDDTDENNGDADAQAPDAEAAEGDDANEEAPDPTVELRTTNETLSKRNRELLSELETARKTPRTQRGERETALVAAEDAYIEEGSVPALRKFLSVIVGAAPDSKEVDAELAGLYTDLTARELGVPLDENQKVLRDNARTRLERVRDKREKAEADKKVEPDNSVGEINYTQAAQYTDNLLNTKDQSGASVADEYPMLMNMAQDFDGYSPSEVIARAIRQEIMTGTLDPKGKQDVDMVRAVAAKIEQHYDGVAKRIEAARAKQRKPGTTAPSVKPKAASEPSKEQRQSTGARTLTNAAASRAPAKTPKVVTKQKASTAEKTRRDFPSEAAWRDHLLNKHFKA